MVEIYPYGGFLAYLKYHYIDGLIKQTLMLFDKTRYDYENDNRKSVLTGTPKSDSEVLGILKGFNLNAGQPKKE